MAAAALSGDLVVGLVLGLFLGMLFGRPIRSWLAWQEWVNASREADLISREAYPLGRVLDSMEADRPAVHEQKPLRDSPRPGARKDIS